jgi:hypothetical protein
VEADRPKSDVNAGIRSTVEPDEKTAAHSTSDAQADSGPS